jgi:hypothetical protein
MTRQASAMVLTVAPTPLINPPPPMGTTTASVSGASSTISRPTVAAPAMTSASLYAEMNAAPVPAANCFARRSA